MASKPWRDRDRLYELHTEKCRSQSEIADELGCSRPTVAKWLDEYDIEKGTPDYKKEGVLREMVESSMTYEEMAGELDCSAHTVLRWCQKYDLNGGRGCHSHKRRSGRAHFTTDAHGYERATCTMTKDVVKIHRLVAVAEYGYDAVAGNVVHHKNFLSWDNRPSNLEPMGDAEHRILHLRKKMGDDET